jgi:N utilization substance protein A
MASDRITIEELRLLSIFQEFTGAAAYRCIRDEQDNKLYFLVNPSDIGRAIGKRGINVKMLSKLLGKPIEIIPYSPEMPLEEFVSKLLSGARVLGIRIIEKNVEKRLIVRVEEADKGKAIGRGGRNIERARKILKILYDIDKIIVS